MFRVTSLIKQYVKLILLVVLLIPASIQAQTLNIPYSHYSANENLASVLTDFARTQHLNANISPKLTGTISGRFDNVNPNVFLQGLEAAFGVRYYINNGFIYFYHDSEWTQSIFKPSSVSPQNLLHSLQVSKLVSNNLPIRVDSNGLMVIEGPKSYVDGIINVAREFDYGQENQVAMRVFKLKHAKAEDIQISSMDKTVNIPGVASILQRMVNGSNVQGSAMTVTTHSAEVPGLRGTGLSALTNAASNTDAQRSDATSVDIQGAQSRSNLGFNPNIIADSRLNAVIIQDFQYRMPYYADVIKELDVPVRLVELHAAIVDIDVNETKNLGVDWNASRVDGNWGAGVGSGNVNWDGSFPVSNSAGGGIFSTIFQTSHSSFMAQVNLLEQDNKARTLGKPSVLTLDNVEATLENTTTNYIPVQGYQDSDLFKIESGTVLRVTPHIIDNKDGKPPLIQMVITLQSNQDSGDNLTVDVNGNTVIPSIKQTKINTQALVREGQSLLLGGYYVEDAQNGDTGIPKLKDVPVAGGLFGSENESSSKRERLLLITPRILSLDELNVPGYVDYQQFEKSPTQSDYKVRSVKKEESSGCSSNRQSK